MKQGTGSIAGLREDRRNVAKAVYPLHYGAFSSHGPTYDSTFANLTKEETEMVHNTYGDEVGVQYAESILNFSRNCDYAMSIVDHLLDILTGNEHRKTSKCVFRHWGWLLLDMLGKISNFWNVVVCPFVSLY